LVRDGTGYCGDHQEDRKIGKFADKRRGSRQSRGYGAEWEQTRKRILCRDKGLCQPCLKAGRPRPAKQVDHIVPKFEGGTDADDNLQSICKDCHDAKTAAEARRGRGM
jgi:5-methylcytosine-specific restriction protein A